MIDDGLYLALGDESAPSSPSPHNITHRRKIGAFYTPLNVAEILCKWAVRTPRDMVLEPCFGGCTFLEALRTRLQNAGQPRPSENIYGCDNDPLAFSFLEGIEDISDHREKFILMDFLSVTEVEIAARFDAVVGNPPYIRHSKFGSHQKEAIAAWSKRLNIQVDGRSSLWAYFILHALNFLKPNGRVAWVLPLSFLTSAYAANVRKVLAKCFEKVVAITLTERLFIGEGTEEATVVLLAEGFSTAHVEVPIYSYCVDTVSEMEALILDLTATMKTGLTIEQHGTGMIPANAIETFKTLMPEHASILADWASIQIGLVTGDVPFFVKTKTAWERLNIDSKHLRYIAPKTKWLQGVNLANADALRHVENDVPCLALDCPNEPSSLALKKYLASYGVSDIQSNSTFRKRDKWHYFFDEKIPDAFIAFMTHFGPRFIVNDAQANCTNSLYRVFLKNNAGVTQCRLIAISLNSTYTQFSAELLGQGRGAGALKLDPSHCASLKLILPSDKSVDEIDETFHSIDQLLRENKAELARNLADRFIFGCDADVHRSLSILEHGLTVGRTRRMQTARKSNKA
jgi:hypothetical protein